MPANCGFSGGTEKARGREIRESNIAEKLKTEMVKLTGLEKNKNTKNKKLSSKARSIHHIPALL